MLLLPFIYKKNDPAGYSEGVNAISYRVLFTHPYNSFMGQPVVHLAWMVLPQPIHELITIVAGQTVLDDEQCCVSLTVLVVLTVICCCLLQCPTVGEGEVSVVALPELARIGLQRLDECVEIDNRVLPEKKRC